MDDLNWEDAITNWENSSSDWDTPLAGPRRGGSSAGYMDYVNGNPWNKSGNIANIKIVESADIKPVYSMDLKNFIDEFNEKLNESLKK